VPRQRRPEGADAREILADKLDQIDRRNSMAGRQVKADITSVILAELAATRLILRALIEGVLPPEQDKAWQELEAMTSRIEAIAKQSAVKGAPTESSDQIMKAAAEMATEFVRSIGPKPVRQ
jgi:hypothetical protein